MSNDDKQYIVKRSNIFIGKLYAISKNSPDGNPEWIFCRNMIIKINSNNLAQDLVFHNQMQNFFAIDTIKPSYIVNNDLKVLDLLSLDKVLKHLGYGEELTEKDIKQVYNHLLRSKLWLRLHNPLFVSKKRGSKIQDETNNSSSKNIEDLYNELVNFIGKESAKPHKREKKRFSNII